MKNWYTAKASHGTIVNDDVVRRTRAICADRQKRLSAIKTREDAEAYINEVRAKIRKAFPLPAEKTPLNPQITRTTDMGDYTIDCVIFESRPGFPVSAALYTPKTPGPHPAILFLIGHSQTGKAADQYQLSCRMYAQMGYTVLAVDPIAQGERYQFIGVPGAESISGACCSEHNTLGKQLLLCGDFFGAWRSWDAIRGVDFLLSRPDVDASRIAVTGTSGGGTMTTFAFTLDERLAIAAPSSYITTWQRNIENELPVDSEQAIPRLLGQGLEMTDLLIAAAPRPVRIMAQINDFFDARGSETAYNEVKRIYELLGAGDDVSLIVGPDLHGYTHAHRMAASEFFNSQFGVNATPVEPTDKLVEELRCTETGQLSDNPKWRLVHDFILDEAERLRKSRRELSLEELRSYFANALGLPAVDSVAIPPYRMLRPMDAPNYKVGRFRLEKDDGVDVILRLVADDYMLHIPMCEKARLLIPHMDSLLEHEDMPIGDGLDVLLDVRGIGELEPSSGPQVGRDFFHPYQYDYYYDSVYRMLGESYLGGRVRDIFSAVALLRSKGCKDLTLRGHGQGAIPTAIAALFLDCKVELAAAPVSWENMALSRANVWPQAVLIENVLATTDLPDLYKALGDRLTILSNWDMVKPVFEEGVDDR